MNDKTGLYIGDGAVVASQTGNITLRGTNTLETSGQLCNSVRFEATDAANSIRIGFDGTNAYSGNITIQGNSIYQRSNHTGAGSIAIQTTGTLTMEPTGSAFTYLRAGNAGTLTFDNDWNFGTNLGGFVFGKTTNTTALTYSNALATSGPITIYGGALALNANLNTTNTSTGNILLQGTTITGTGNIGLAAGRTATINVSANSSYAGLISGTGSGLTKLGAGLLTLTNDHTYTGATNINAGDLQVGTGGDLNTASSGTIPTTSGVVVANGSKLILSPNDNVTFAAPISGAGGVEIKGTSGSYYNVFLTATPATIASNSTVLEVLTRITAGLQRGGAISTSSGEVAGAYHKNYNASANTATLQFQQYMGTFTKCVFVRLSQSGTNVQISANTSIYSGAAYRSGNTLGTDMSSSPSLQMGLATSAGAAGYGISKVYMSGKVNFTGVLTYTGNTVLSNTITNGTSPTTHYYVSKGTQEITDVSSAFPAASAVVNNGLVIFNRATAITHAHWLANFYRSYFH